jgi:hypothetical protein
MDKETVKRFGVEHGLGMQVIDGDDWSEANFIWFDNDMTKFAKACCEWQKKQDAQICDRIAKISKVDALAELCADACASAIRNTKDTETDLEQAQRFT